MRLHCGVVMTTNHMASGIYIPADDRRYDVIETATLAEMGLTDVVARRTYFENLWTWFDRGGAAHVAAWLNELDISKCSASNGQRKTAAHRSVIAFGFLGDGWLSDVLEVLGNPDCVRSDEVVSVATAQDMTREKTFARMQPALLRAGYQVYPNNDRLDHSWPVTTYGKSRRATVYVKRGIGTVDIKAVLARTVTGF